MHRTNRTGHTNFQKSGGGERVRTDDPLLAKQVLSQLSYTPTVRLQSNRHTHAKNKPRMAE